MSGEYNILPLALGTDYFVLARAGLTIPPLRRSGVLTLDARLAGSPWLGSRDAGRVDGDARLACSGWFTGYFRDVGRFDAAQADLTTSPTLAVPETSWDLEAATSAGPLLGYPLDRFGLDADTPELGTFLAVLKPIGPFSVDATPAGAFERLVWWVEPQPVTAQRIYTCTLTGAANGLDDILLPMESFQFRLYAHGGSHLSVVVPDADMAGISARLAGQIIVRQGWRTSDGDEKLLEMARAGRIHYQRTLGPGSSLLTITAGESVTFSFDPGVPKAVTRLISRSMLPDGTWQFRTPPIFGLYPGDAVQIEGQPWHVTRISVAVGSRRQTMDILSDGPTGA